MQIHLTDRQQHILWATVRHYIATAEPVGSKALLEEYKLSVSPATVRNAMNVLEKAGLLYQPHTSAGRVPSDSGYRIYVDQLISPDGTLARQVEQLLQDKLNKENWSFEALLQGAAQILATLSGYITLITMPQTRTTQLRHLQLVQMEPGQVMLIVVMDNYETQSVLMELPIPIDVPKPDAEIIDRELQILSNFLNSQLRGRSLLELAALDWTQIDREFQSYGEFLKNLFAEVSRRSQPAACTQILIRGVAEVLRQPEFSELQQIKTLIHLLEEEQDQLWPLIFESPEVEGIGESQAGRLCHKNQQGKRVTVRIGAENPLEPIRTCTLISATYRQGTVPVGSVGVLGPTRMVYENAIAVVEAAADYLSEALS
ncbi:heat-inducible transcriptional repressor HrcA [Planktothrix sp. FACHB-1355]|uniref:Heat-inducible transcription repressor HrcA n=1 Tax=Aerosakkonema funiforme FACHB-1375 TaxID=2949571 RepID=A0A926ZJR0_9CYAN|nr:MULTISPECIES: heat-inducible transcriptional repressor HrcA [Oscillatoriales]MBD2184627.1 heat-inducible transcriptional repressor HrcA [Aerosakkonema funiforme FACHB-1375]MBD3559012.1 heat-inducible transcriptional repressor HrcA [Planktothrix sp. FACHB-1355]